MKVAELFGELGIEPDRASMARARDEFGRFIKGTAKQAERGGQEIGRSLFGRMYDRGRGGLAAALTPKDFGRDLRIGAQGAALGAGAVVAMSLRDEFNFDKELQNLDINSDHAMGKLDDLRETILRTAKATGVAKEQVVAFSKEFVALTGDGEMARKALEVAPKMLFNSDVEAKDVAGSAAAVIQQLKIAPAELEKAFSGMIRAGKQGSVEIADMAALMSTLAAQYKQFGDSQGLAGLARLNAAFQIVKKNFGSPSEASTGLERLMESFTMQRTIKSLRGFGIELYELGDDGVKRLKPLLEIIDAIASDEKYRKDPAQFLGKAFESSPAKLALRALIDNRRALDDIAEATRSATDLQDDYAQRAKSESGQMTKAWNDLKVAVTDAFMPERVHQFTEALKGTVVVAEKLLTVSTGWVEAISEGAGWLTSKVFDFRSEAQVRADEDEIVKREFAGKSDEYVATQAKLGNMGAMQEQRRRAREVRYDRNYRVTRGRSDVEMLAARYASAAPSEIVMQRGGNSSITTVNVGGIVVKGATDPARTAKLVEERFRFFLDQEKVALGAF